MVVVVYREMDRLYTVARGGGGGGVGLISASKRTVSINFEDLW